MRVKVFQDRESLGKTAAAHAAVSLRNAIRKQGNARFVAATGASQFEFLDCLTKEPNIDWRCVELFHLDEYVGLPRNHRASFRKYLFERLIDKTGITKYHLIDTEGDLQEIVKRIGDELKAKPIDMAFVGIGENGHLAFNDPPADFETESPLIIVNLDEACRRQQVGEGWFSDVSEVPRQAVSMSIRQILKAKEIFAMVPDERKAKAIKACCEGEVDPLVPASILRTHSRTTVFLDMASAALLKPETIAGNGDLGLSSQ